MTDELPVRLRASWHEGFDFVLDQTRGAMGASRPKMILITLLLQLQNGEPISLEQAHFLNQGGFCTAGEVTRLWSALCELYVIAAEARLHLVTVKVMTGNASIAQREFKADAGRKREVLCARIRRALETISGRTVSP